MRVVVLTKQIPDPANPGRLDPATLRLDRGGALVLDEADSYGVEVALRLVAGDGGDGEVTLVSMAPGAQTAGLRAALAMGATGAHLVSDDALVGSDALGTARVLAAVVTRVAADLVLAATESGDGYTGTVAAQVAELLGLPSVTFAKRVELAGGGRSITAWRQTGGGHDEVSCDLPALVSLTAGGVEPRYPSYRAIVAAKSKPIRLLGLADLDVDANQVGATGARQEVVEVVTVAARQAGEVLVDDGDAHERIVGYLETLKVI